MTKPKQEPAPFEGGTTFKGLQGKPDFDWRDAPLKPMPLSALPPHLQAAHRLKCMPKGPSMLWALKREAADHAWTMERFQQACEHAIEDLKKKKPAAAPSTGPK